MTKEKNPETQTKETKGTPAIRSVLLRVEKDQEGVVHPRVLSDGKELVGAVSRRMHRGTVVIDATVVRNDESFEDLTYRIWDNHSNLVGSGRIRKPGKYTFWVERAIAKDGTTTDGYVGRMNYEDPAHLRLKQRQLFLCERGNPQAWQAVEVVKLKNGTPTIGIKFFDGSYIDLAGKHISEYMADGRLVRTASMCMARIWKGRPLTGVWKIGKYTPILLERLFVWLEAYHEEQDRFPLFEDFPELATIVQLGKGTNEYEIVAQLPE